MAKKTESTLINMVLALGGIALVASALLGFVYEITKEPIEIAKKAKLEEAIKLVSPEGVANTTVGEVYQLPIEGNDPIDAYPVMDESGNLVVTAISTYTDNGFSGRFRIMVGFRPDGSIVNTAVLEHAETPGLGDKMDKKKSLWSKQYNGKNPADFNLKVKQDGGDVDAITAATISSRAFSDAVDRAYNALMKGGSHE